MAGQDSRRRWLAYDGRGAISSRADEGFHVVECTLHDTSISRKRPPLLNDFFGFSLAALGDKAGALHVVSFCKVRRMEIKQRLNARTPASAMRLRLSESKCLCGMHSTAAPELSPQAFGCKDSMWWALLLLQEVTAV